jgi:iron-sulfur cluster repair protein YtfE (RIC family)
MAENAAGARHLTDIADITELIVLEHERFRRRFLGLWDLRHADDDVAVQVALSAWRSLADLLEVHATAEEEIFYPELLTRGGDEATAETDDAVHDHNDIRDAIRAAQQAPAGTDDWWDAILACRTANDEHLAEEERDVLPDFREHSDEQLRRQLGARWAAFHEAHRGARGISGDDVDVDAYIAEQAG